MSEVDFASYLSPDSSDAGHTGACHVCVCALCVCFRGGRGEEEGAHVARST